MKKITLSLLIVSSLLAGGITKQQENVEAFSISLSVSDISASKAFYEKLGFTQIEGAGSIDQKWMIMKNGAAKVGLFQGFFPKNTITLNPKDARSIYKKATDSGLEALFKSGMDKEEGPASFSLLDPDGNPVLIDQHQ